jgi:hypothetical protein
MPMLEAYIGLCQVYEEVFGIGSHAINPVQRRMVVWRGFLYALVAEVPFDVSKS